MRKTPRCLHCSQKLLNYKDDITHHLQSCHLSKLVGKIQEHELILARTGMFCVPTEKQKDMFNMPKAQIQLGPKLASIKDMPIPIVFWTKEKAENNDIVKLEMTKSIQLQFGVTVPVGSGNIYRPTKYTWLE